MKYLLDTHTALWFSWDHPNISAKTKDIIRLAKHDCLLSVASVWEIAIKVSIGKLILAAPYKEFIEQMIEDNHYNLLEINLVHTAITAELPLHHRDPFDRLLIAQSLAEGIPLISGDSSFDAYKIQRVW